MCEALVRVRDKVNTTSAVLDAGCMKRGDVVAVKPDGWTWGKKELTNPDWRILSAPNYTVAQAEELLAPESPPDTLRVYVMLRKRAVAIDLDALGIALNPDVYTTTPVVVGGETINAINKVPVTRQMVRAAIKVKTRLPEPTLIGPQDESVIGPK